MKKISFKDISTRDELLTRIETDKTGKHSLSVGCYLNNIKKFLKNEKVNDEIEVNVSYSSTYSTTTKKYFI